ncbi:helix-turn-helix transcriptional regulator [Actinoplanes sp. M2I2]|uniref:helix-turn-helix domain-containing protein n=1 Tax=Actinoplanes sp. M2I2 TaxID=1734444 RepID=UPI0020213AEB|nr:helix-turn-helix transcriptional regulator [Actinoplanes sp. M2I2]
MPTVTTLADRLKELRTSARPGQPLTQRALSRVLGVSVPLISSWEHGIVPPIERLDDYALFFALAEPVSSLPALEQLSVDEQQVYQELRRDLHALRGRGAGLPDALSEPEIPHPLRFPPGQAITIVPSELPAHVRNQFGDVSRPQGPDYVESYKYADLDALIELLSFIRGMNPTNPTTVGVPRELSTDDLTAHLIALGGVDFNEVTEAALTDLSHVPVKQLRRETFQETGAFSVGDAGGRRVEYSPKLRRDQGSTTLKEDVAHFLRAPNPYNRERTLTFFNGMYSRGSYGIVRALTDPKIQERNAAYVDRRFHSTDTYSIVCRVKIVANEVVVPDWTVDDIRLHEWPEAERDRSSGTAAH